MHREIRFAHLSDWHATTLVGGGLDRFRGKRISGWASWALNRRRHHDPAILDAAIRDVHAQSVDRILVTGDLTHISLPQEFRVAAGQLARLGSPEEVFLIPGNHDCYVRTDPENAWDHWAPYLRGAASSALPSALAPLASPSPEDGRAPTYADYPTLRIHDRLAIIGLCSSIPTPIFVAGGELGAQQLERLEALLSATGDAGYFRVLMIHHPIAAGTEPARRALWDGEALCGVLARTGAELVLHGHKHRRRLRTVPGPRADVPIVGVPSTSEVGSQPDKQAQYHVYTVREEAGGAFTLGAEIRGYDAAQGAFVPVSESLFG
ncbi:MAG: metallophosphoesterase family protein [Myxococcota bacterium]